MNSLTDVRIWVWDHADPSTSPEDIDAMVAAIQAGDHPPWGRDWTNYLAGIDLLEFTDSLAWKLVIVDDEFNAEEWWGALRERFPVFAHALALRHGAIIAGPLWEELAAIPGFGDGPDYAKVALIDQGDLADNPADWQDYDHFESLS